MSVIGYNDQHFKIGYSQESLKAASISGYQSNPINDNPINDNPIGTYI